MDKLQEIINRRPRKWGNLTLKEFERDIKILQHTAKKVKELEEENRELTDKLADIRELFNEEDIEAEGHGMEDMISSPYAVACYAERKLKRLMVKD